MTLSKSGFQIAGRKIGNGYPVYIVAEIGCLYTDFAGAKLLIDAAVAAGADAVKTQNFKAKTEVSPQASMLLEVIGPEPVNQAKFMKPYEQDDKLLIQIGNYARKKKITLFSSFNHPTDVDQLEHTINPSAYKIASEDVTNLALLDYVAQLKKPIILSTGMSTLKEVHAAVDTIRKHHSCLAILHCVSDYPLHAENANLRAITTLKREFPGIPIGWSDHSVGKESLSINIAAVALGASIVEKHFKESNRNTHADAIHAATREDLKKMIAAFRVVEKALGTGEKRPTETININEVRKGLMTMRKFRAGEIFTLGNGFSFPYQENDEKNIRVVRPRGNGLRAELFLNGVKVQAKNNIPATTMVTADMIKFL